MAKIKLAKDLPIYERAIARYPHLASLQDAKMFCWFLCDLEAVETITPKEYWSIGAVANDGDWYDDSYWAERKPKHDRL